MLNEHTRELKYTAQLAGILFDTGMASEAVSFKLVAYNDSYHAFFAEVFREVKSFTPVKSFFEDKK